MIPDLGKYADAVLSAYAASIMLLVIVVAVSLWKGRRIRSALARIETRIGRTGPDRAQ